MKRIVLSQIAAALHLLDDLLHLLLHQHPTFFFNILLQTDGKEQQRKHFYHTYSEYVC